ncbi:uncharacterized protein [Onthophagus taurus]|uniref:uncharacterized protein n=1 Tax=Onthophagus taurus TaxID=166361 RepID=UPI0039BE0B2C
MSAVAKGNYLSRMWSTSPEIVGSSFMAAIGLGLAGLGLYTYYSKDGDNRRYKFQYTVIRDDDPRAAKVRKD